MAGHSHSANIARRKGAVDAQRARIFSKCSRALHSAVRQGGPDPSANLKLRYAIEKARAANMPKDNIDRAVKKAAGEGAGDISELTYEGYGAGGVALMVSCLTDNRNRTSADLKHLFERGGGNLGTPGSVGYLFQHRSILAVERGERDEDAWTELALEVGADDVQIDGDTVTLYAASTDFLEVKSALEEHGIAFLSAEIGYVPLSTVAVTDREAAASILRLVDLLDQNDDVQDVYANYDIPAEWIEELAS